MCVSERAFALDGICLCSSSGGETGNCAQYLAFAANGIREQLTPASLDATRSVTSFASLLDSPCQASQAAFASDNLEDMSQVLETASWPATQFHASTGVPSDRIPGRHLAGETSGCKFG